MRRVAPSMPRSNLVTALIGLSRVIDWVALWKPSALVVEAFMLPRTRLLGNVLETNSLACRYPSDVSHIAWILNLISSNTLDISPPHLRRTLGLRLRRHHAKLNIVFFFEVFLSRLVDHKRIRVRVVFAKGAPTHLGRIAHYQQNIFSELSNAHDAQGFLQPR